MASSKNDVKEALFAAAVRNKFLDPLTNSEPTSETELSGLLAYFQQIGAIDWSDVPLLDTEGRPVGYSSEDLLSSTDLVVSEYPLFCRSASESDIWGEMRADLLFISEQRSSVVLVENKIGSEFTGNGDDPETGQLAKQADFLIDVQEHGRFQSCAQVIITTKEYVKNDWYGGVLKNTLAVPKRYGKVNGYQLCWEDIFHAIRRHLSA